MCAEFVTAIIARENTQTHTEHDYEKKINIEKFFQTVGIGMVSIGKELLREEVCYLNIDSGPLCRSLATQTKDKS